jgi:hypothetical protein
MIGLRQWLWAVAVCSALLAMPAATDAADGLPAPTWAFGAEAASADAPLRSPRAWRVSFDHQAPGPEVAALSLASVAPAGDEQRPTAITYSDGYALRRRIHKIASFATLPLFGAQYLLGEKLDDGSRSESVRATHAAIATSMVGLFGINTVTGVWNLWEGRHDPNGRTRRLFHSLLMLGADAGFVATGMLAPTNDGGGNQRLHRTVALTSIGVATGGYLLMLFGG